MIAYNRKGIFNHEDLVVSGEEYVIKNWLPRFLESCSIKNPVFFDVGANVGNYAKLLADTFPQSVVYAFEPYPSTFADLQRAVAAYSNVQLQNVALSSQEGSLELWTEPNDPEAPGHTTAYRDVLTTQFTYTNVVSARIPSETLDGFCQVHHVQDIHFLKIDTEGHEMEVLRGATELLKQKRLCAVQFEFNEMHIISRVFLRDFVTLFVDFNLYRLMEDRLQLLRYSSEEEIFLFQNFLAVRKDIDRVS